MPQVEIYFCNISQIFHSGHKKVKKPHQGSRNHVNQVVKLFATMEDRVSAWFSPNPQPFREIFGGTVEEKIGKHSSGPHTKRLKRFGSKKLQQSDFWRSKIPENGEHSKFDSWVFQRGSCKSEGEEFKETEGLSGFRKIETREVSRSVFKTPKSEIHFAHFHTPTFSSSFSPEPLHLSRGTGESPVIQKKLSKKAFFRRVKKREFWHFSRQFEWRPVFAAKGGKIVPHKGCTKFHAISARAFRASEDLTNNNNGLSDFGRASIKNQNGFSNFSTREGARESRQQGRHQGCLIHSVYGGRDGSVEGRENL